jgi:hypothetical protein
MLPHGQGIFMSVNAAMPALLTCAVILTAGPVLAADESLVAAATGTVEGKETYVPLQFARFAPRSALDMLLQVPGFAIVGEDRARGLGEASGNVLINGARLSSKADSARDQLSRIAIANVVRIEIVDGAALEIPGLSGRVANIIARSGGMTGQFEWDGQLPTQYALGRWSQGKISVSGRRGPVDYTLALSNEPFRGGSGGTNYFRDAASQIVESRLTVTQTINDQPRLSGRFRYDQPGGLRANLSLSYHWDLFNFREIEDVTQPAAPLLQELLRTRRHGHDYEIGGDVEFGLGPGRLKLIALERFEHDDFSTQSTLFADGSRPDSGSRFTLLSDSGERIARAEYGWKQGRADWQLSAEAAFNRLDNLAGLFSLQPDGSLKALPFPAGTGGVTESRYESILSYGRPLSSSLTLQLAAGGEYSTLAQTGSNARRRSFQRPKGTFTLAWAPKPGFGLSFKLRRTVGQLNLGDFLAEVNLAFNNSNSGNNELVPEQRWQAEVEIAKALGAWGSATVNLYVHRIEDFVTIVPLAGGVESQGNIDTARLRGIKLKGTLQFDPLGWRGAKLDVDGYYEEASYRDPLTGQRLAFNFQRDRNVEATFRHDIPDSEWAWGVNVRNSHFKPYFRLKEAGSDFDVVTFGAVFIEHKNVFGLTVRGRMANIFDGESILYRTVYAGPRNSAPIAFIEDRNRKIGLIWNLSIKGSF